MSDDEDIDAWAEVERLREELSEARLDAREQYERALLAEQELMATKAQLERLKAEMSTPGNHRYRVDL